MEQVQLIIEKEMISKLLKQFTIRVFTYSFLYFVVLVALFIFEPIIGSAFWAILLIVATNILFLMMLSKISTTEAFDGINTTSAPKQSLNRISSVANIPTLIFTGIISFLDVIFLHGYKNSTMNIFAGIVIINILVWVFVIKIYEKRVLKKYLVLEEEKET